MQADEVAKKPYEPAITRLTGTYMSEAEIERAQDRPRNLLIAQAIGKACKTRHRDVEVTQDGQEETSSVKGWCAEPDSQLTTYRTR